MNGEKVVLNKEQALSMMADGDHVHTYRSGGLAIVGCDWSRDKLVAAIEANDCELGGSMCQCMNHGLVIHVDGSPLFVECKPGFDYAALESRTTEARTNE